MAYLDTAHVSHKPISPVVWEAMMARLDLGPAAAARQPATAGADGHLRYVQRMLLAAAMASGAILAVAAVMMLRVL